MKYIPLIWAALWRKPVEAVLTWLAVTTAFALFGLMVGTHATYSHMIDSARMDRISVNAAFETDRGQVVSLAMRDQIARFDGVAGIGVFSGLAGYYQDPNRSTYVMSVDEGMKKDWSELPLSSAQWDQLFSTPTGIVISKKIATRFQLKAGDPFPLTTGPGTRADDATVWHFQVLGIVEDDPGWSDGHILGNYRYIDQSRPLAIQGLADGFRVAVTDPSRAVALAKKIDRFFANSSIPTMSYPIRIDAINSAHSYMDMGTKSLYVAGAGLFMILFLTANGIAQSVRERLPEFAVLETIGFGHHSIMGLVFAEAAAPCLLGAVLGVGLATVLLGWPTRFLPAALSHLRPPTLSPMVFAWALIFAIGLALAGSVIPLQRLRHLRVTDALAGR